MDQMEFYLFLGEEKRNRTQPIWFDFLLIYKGIIFIIWGPSDWKERWPCLTEKAKEIAARYTNKKEREYTSLKETWNGIKMTKKATAKTQTIYLKTVLKKVRMMIASTRGKEKILKR